MSDWGEGLPFVRRLELLRVDENRVAGSIEDHVHHFRADLEHDGSVVTAVDGTAVRAPWTVCPGSVGQLRDLVGAPVGVFPQVPDPFSHCTHLLDIACHTVSFAGTAVEKRVIDVTVEGWDTREQEAVARRDDGLELAWSVRAGAVVSPDRWAGRNLGAGFTAWAHGSLDPEEFELALILRRATWMSPARGIDLDNAECLFQAAPGRGVCYASQPERADRARRNVGSSRAGVPVFVPLTARP